MQADARFNRMMAGVRVRFVTLDEFLPRHGTIAYGVPLTLAYAKAILDLGDSAIGAYVILMNADVVLASGSMRSVVARIRDGYDVIGASGIRVIDGRPRAALEQHVDPESGVLSMAPRAMMRLANAHLHSTITGRILNDESPIDSTYYHQIYWRISDDCLAMRAFLLHPFCFRIRRLVPTVFSAVDYGCITELCPDGRFCALCDSDDFLMIELQARDSESHWLRPAPAERSLERRLSRLGAEIAAHAATWTTAYHRLAATQTLYYHETDLPSGLGLRTRRFDLFVDTILEAMPPPVSHVGHFQWLPAVRYYREAMIRGGADAAIALLDDPRNEATTP
jgi:hypothetical protein